MSSNKKTDTITNSRNKTGGDHINKRPNAKDKVIRIKGCNVHRDTADLLFMKCDGLIKLVDVQQLPDKI